MCAFAVFRRRCCFSLLLLLGCSLSYAHLPASHLQYTMYIVHSPSLCFLVLFSFFFLIFFSSCFFVALRYVLSIFIILNAINITVFLLAFAIVCKSDDDVDWHFATQRHHPYACVWLPSNKSFRMKDEKSSGNLLHAFGIKTGSCVSGNKISAIKQFSLSPCKSLKRRRKAFLCDDKTNKIHSNVGFHWNAPQFFFWCVVVNGFSCVYISGQRLFIVLNKHDFSDFCSFSISKSTWNMVISLFCMSLFFSLHLFRFKTTNQLRLPVNRVTYLH